MHVDQIGITLNLELKSPNSKPENVVGFRVYGLGFGVWGLRFSVFWGFFGEVSAGKGSS